jgi:hypothetical protein
MQKSNFCSLLTLVVEAQSAVRLTRLRRVLAVQAPSFCCGTPTECPYTHPDFAFNHIVLPRAQDTAASRTLDIMFDGSTRAPRAAAPKNNVLLSETIAWSD